MHTCAYHLGPLSSLYVLACGAACLHACRYLLYGDVSFRVAEALRKPEVQDFFARLIQRVAPKSWDQASAEVRVTRKFYENFCGDQVGEHGRARTAARGPPARTHACGSAHAPPRLLPLHTWIEWVDGWIG